MSHRKFRAPRHGSLKFLPRKRCRRHRGRIRSFPPDDRSKDCHLTAFIGYKAGMTHIMRQLQRPGSKAHGRDIVEAVTIIECPPVMVTGIVGYIRTPSGLRSISTVWCAHMDDSFRRRFYKNWRSSKQKAFNNWQEKFSGMESGQDPKEVTRRLNIIKTQSDVVRVIVHSQVKKLKCLGMKKAHILEIQVNGGTIAQKVDFAYKLLESEVPVATVFHENETVDTIAVTRGHGWKGVVNRWGVTRLPRKTHRGLRKVACIGSWHPARVQFNIAREGQKGYHHRTEIHKKIYRIGDRISFDDQGKPTSFNASTEMDLTQKNITPMGGFVGYGQVLQDYIMIKGSCPGVRKRPITLRKAIVQPSSTTAREEIKLKFIDTASKYGHGRFQSQKEKQEWFGPTKKDKTREAKKEMERKRREKAQIKAKLRNKKGAAAAAASSRSSKRKDEDEYKYLSKNERRRRKSKGSKGSKKKGKKSKK